MSSDTIVELGEQKDHLQSEKRKREEQTDDANTAKDSLGKCDVKEPEAKKINNPRICDDCDSEGEEERKCKNPKTSDDENNEFQVCGYCDSALCEYHASLHIDDGMEWCDVCSNYMCNLCRIRLDNEHMHCPGCGEELEDDRDRDDIFCSECEEKHGSDSSD